MTPQAAKSKGKYKHAVDLQDYFEQRTTCGIDNQCWTFATKGDKDGYPQVTGSKHCKALGLTRAHQVAYFLYKGPIPNNKIVCHSCDNPTCVNPEHLFLGTWDDNVQDMINKGRYRHPTTYGKAMKINRQQKQQIKNLKGVKTSAEVGRDFNISFSRVCQIWREE